MDRSRFVVAMLGWLGGGGLAIGEFSSRPLALRIRTMRARKLDKAPDDF